MRTEPATDNWIDVIVAVAIAAFVMAGMVSGTSARTQSVPTVIIPEGFGGPVCATYYQRASSCKHADSVRWFLDQPSSR